MNIYLDIIPLVSAFSIFVPLAIYLLRIKKVRKQIHSIGILVIISGICDLIGFTLLQEKLPTAFIINAFFLLQFFFLSHYYYGTVFSNKPDTVLGITMLQYASGLFILTLFYDEFRTQHLNLVWAVSGIILIGYSVLYFKKIIKSYQVPRIYRYGSFWINSGVFLYLSLSLWIFVIRSDTRMVQLSDDTYQMLWSFYRVNNVLKNLMFAAGIYYSVRKPINADVSVTPVVSEA